MRYRIAQSRCYSQYRDCGNAIAAGGTGVSACQRRGRTHAARHGQSSSSDRHEARQGRRASWHSERPLGPGYASASSASTARWTLPWTWSAPIRSMTPSARSTARTCGFTRASRSVTPSASVSWWISVELRGALGVDEVDALEVEDERSRLAVRVGERADAILERFRGGEEQPAVEAQDGDAGERLVVGVLVEVAEDLVPASRPSSGIGGRVATYTSHPSESDDADDDAREHAGRQHPDDRRDRDPEVEPRHPAQRRSSATSIMPNTTASMITAPSTALGRLREQRRQDDQRPDHEAPVTSEATGVRAPARLVERAGREARRHRHALEHAGADVRHPLGDRLLVDVDPVAVARGERPRVAGGLREPDQQQRDRGDGDDARVVARRGRGRAARARAGRAGRRRRARRRARRGRTGPRRAARRRRAPARPGPPARAKRSPRMTASETAPTSTVVQWTSSSEPSHDASSRHALSPSAAVPVSLGSSPMTTSTAAPARNPVTTAFERKLGDPAHPQSASSRNSTPVASAIAATSCAASRRRGR